MIIPLLILTAGLLLLYFGSEILVEGAASTAVMFAVRPVIIGLTVVSLATSAPELLVSMVAAVKGSGAISIGNILGSNVINIALVLGISAMIRPVSVKRQVTIIEIPYMVAVSIIFWGMCLDGTINRMDGIILIGFLIGFLVYGILTAREKNNPGTGSEDPASQRSSKKLLKNFMYIILGIGMLGYGAELVVSTAIGLAEKIGLSQTFIGISVVAFGTSLPELATSAVAAARGQSDISVGNVVGSNLFNICLVMGVVGICNPMHIDKSLHLFQFPFMIFVCLALGAITYKYKGVNQGQGLIFVILFFVYIAVSYFI